jgi:hypothetical protein
LSKNYKKPKDSSSLALIVKVLFKAFPKIKAQKLTQKGQQIKEYVYVQLLLIPKMVDNYNYFINKVDIANQL